MFLWDTLIRLGEAIDIRLEDINVEAGECRIMGKGRKSRTVVFGDTLKKELRAYLGKRTEISHDGYLFCTTKGKKLTRRGFEFVVNTIGMKAGVKAYPHALRRGGACFHARNGMPLWLLQSLGGWSNLTVLKHYLVEQNTEKLKDYYKNGHSPIDSLEKSGSVL